MNPHYTRRTCSSLLLVLLALVALLTSACSDPHANSWSGYAEGDYVYVAAPLGGRLETVAVVAGQTVSKGAPLFQLEAESERAARAEAARRLASATAQAADLDSGKRSAEIAVLRAQLTQAQASAQLAGDDLARQQKLLVQGFAPQARVTDATTTLRQAQAHVDELQAALQVAQLPARSDERNSARANVEAAREVLHENQWRNDQKQQSAPATALVSEVFFQPGEYIAAGQPVVALLPSANIKARFFVPEADLAPLRLGQTVELRCDACSAPIMAHITRIATQPEYTPPVIYSNAQRSKLVYMVEATPDATHAEQPLKPGQPLDVARTAASAASQP